MSEQAEVKENNCTKCGNNLDKTVPITFPKPCTCNYCKDCAMIILNQATEGKFVLGEFEKSNSILIYNLYL